MPVLKCYECSLNTRYMGIELIGIMNRLHLSLTPAACAAAPLSQVKEGQKVPTNADVPGLPLYKNFREGIKG